MSIKKEMGQQSKVKVTGDKFTFCNAPFTSIYVRPQIKIDPNDPSANEVSFCCVQSAYYVMKKDETINDFWISDWAQKHRHQFLNKQWPSSCGECQWRENNDVPSDINTHEHIPVEQYKVEQGNELGKPKYVDYRPDNLCNLMCTMCSPANSNLIEKMWRSVPLNESWYEKSKNVVTSEIVEIYNEHLVTKELIGEHTLQLKVLGGEPTINKKVHSVFQYAIDKGYAKDIDLKITTNFTNMNKTYEMFDEFKSCKINASLDATGPTYDYIRRPAKWSAVRKYLLEFGNRYHDSKKMRWGMNLVWQLANCFTVKEWLPEVFDLFYVNENLKHLHGEGSEISMINCDGTGITLEAVPESMKHYILDDLNDLLKDWKHIPGAKTNIETLIKYTQRAEFTDEHHAVFRKKFRLMDQYKKTDVFKLSPRFKELYEY
jgi:hypothetical protein